MEQKITQSKPQTAIKCPNCGRRLFDNAGASGVIEIKCPKCKTVSRITLK